MKRPDLPLWRLLCAVFAVSCLLTALLAGCQSEPDPTTYVARVGDMVLTSDEVANSLRGLPAGTDTADAREQIVEQWVTRSLLLQEAERLNLRDEPGVQGQMEQQERSILVTALTDRMYREAELAPSMTEIRNFFQSNRGQMTLREPFVQVRHLSTPTRDSAAAARRALQDAASAGRPMDSTFAALVNQHAEFPEQSRRLAATFVPESRLFGHYPYVRDELVELGEGQIAPIVEDDGLYHVLQLVERVPEGTEPELAWVEGEIRRRLMIRSRKQMYAREVQRLRNQALARNDLQFGEASVQEAMAEEASDESEDPAPETQGAASQTAATDADTGQAPAGQAPDATTPPTLAGDTEQADASPETPDASPEPAVPEPAVPESSVSESNATGGADPSQNQGPDETPPADAETSEPPQSAPPEGQSDAPQAEETQAEETQAEETQSGGNETEAPGEDTPASEAESPDGDNAAPEPPADTTEPSEDGSSDTPDSEEEVEANPSPNTDPPADTSATPAVPAQADTTNGT